jgi:hypothetical protein
MHRTDFLISVASGKKRKKECHDDTLLLFVRRAYVDNEILFTSSFFVNKWNLINASSHLGGTRYSVFQSSRKVVFSTFNAGFHLNKLFYVSIDFHGNTEIVVEKPQIGSFSEMTSHLSFHWASQINLDEKNHKNQWL